MVQKLSTSQWMRSRGRRGNERSVSQWMVYGVYYTPMVNVRAAWLRFILPRLVGRLERTNGTTSSGMVRPSVAHCGIQAGSQVNGGTGSGTLVTLPVVRNTIKYQRKLLPSSFLLHNGCSKTITLFSVFSVFDPSQAFTEKWAIS